MLRTVELITRGGLTLRMLATTLPVSLRNWIGYFRSAQHLTPLELERIRAAIVASMDPKYAHEAWGPWLPRSEFNHRLRVGILRAAQLGLDQGGPKLSILDIGCGAGFFMAAAKYHGHSCVGLDLDPRNLPPHRVKAYECCLKAFGCLNDRRILEVTPYQPLALDRKYDLISAGLVCFNEYPSGATWTRAEWEYFLEDVKQYVAPGGRLFLELNEHSHYGRLRWYSAEILDLFRAIGQVNQNKITYTAPLPASGSAR